MNQNKTLYLSGKMTGLPDNGFPLFNEVTALLVDAGYVVNNPAEKGEIPGWTWTDYLKYDLHQVIDSDGVATLSNWRDSKGARLEVRTAKALSKPVKPFQVWIAEATADRVLNSYVKNAVLV